MKVFEEYIYVSLPGRGLSVEFPDGRKFLLKSEMSEAAAELEKYRLEMNSTSNRDNDHKNKVLEYFPYEPGRHYVMSSTPAMALATTGRDMSDVHVYRNGDDGFAHILDYPTYSSMLKDIRW